MKALICTLEALQDRDAISNCIEIDNQAAAIALDAQFAEKAARLVDYPALGRPGRVAETRERIVHRKYIIVYDEEDVAVCFGSCTLHCPGRPHRAKVRASRESTAVLTAA